MTAPRAARRSRESSVPMAWQGVWLGWILGAGACAPANTAGNDAAATVDESATSDRGPDDAAQAEGGSADATTDARQDGGVDARRTEAGGDGASMDGTVAPPPVCHSVMDLSLALLERPQPGAPPALTGGAPVNGFYVLADVQVWGRALLPDGGSSDRLRRRSGTVLVGNGALFVHERADTESPYRATYSIDPAHAPATLTQICPAPSNGDPNAGSWAFTNGRLQLWFPSDQRLMTYRAY